MKKKYRIPAEWVMFGVYEVEAESLEEAIDEVWELPLLDSAEYLSDSFRIIDEELDLYNEDESQ